MTEKQYEISETQLGSSDYTQWGSAQVDTDPAGNVAMPTIWGKAIEAKAQMKRVMRNVVKVNRDLVGQHAKSIELPIKGYWDSEITSSNVSNYIISNKAGDISDDPNTKVQLTYNTVVLTPKVKSVWAKIEEKAIDEGYSDVIRDVEDQIAEVIAQIEDQEIMTEFVRMEETAGSMDPLLNVVLAQSTNANDTPIIKWAADNAGNYQSATYYTAVRKTDHLDIASVLWAKDIVIDKEGFSADTLILHPLQKVNLMKSDQFIDASKYGDPSVRKTGEIGQFFDLKIFSSRRIPTCTISGSETGYLAVMADSSAATIFAVGKDTQIRSEHDLLASAYNLRADNKYDVKRANDRAVCLIASGVG